MDESTAVAIVDAAVPFFFVLIALEVLGGWLTRRKVYRLNDSIADLALGSVSQLTGLWTKIPTIIGFALIGEYLSIQALAGVAEIPLRSPFGAEGVDWVALGWWSLAFVLVDHQYYWGHRFTHQVNVAWSGHVAHHSSEEYNLAVALRQSGTQSFFTMWFHFPLAFVGFSWVHFAVCMGINLIYQFWIHTRLIGRMGPYGWIMNTPSHHRVHHGRNPKYIDKNHAGVFILWDRLYGTFQPEEEEPIYGVTSQLGSHNPVWSNVHHYVFVWRTFFQARGMGDKLRVLFAKTGWRPEHVGGPIEPQEVPADYTKYDPAVPRAVTAYAIVHFLAAVGFMFAITKQAAAAEGAELWWIVGGALFTVFSFSNVASFFDRRPWLAAAEITRLVIMIGMGVLSVALGEAGAPWGWLVAGLGVASLGWFAFMTRRTRQSDRQIATA